MLPQEEFGLGMDAVVADVRAADLLWFKMY